MRQAAKVWRWADVRFIAQCWVDWRRWSLSFRVEGKWSRKPRRGADHVLMHLAIGPWIGRVGIAHWRGQLGPWLPY